MRFGFDHDLHPRMRSAASDSLDDGHAAAGCTKRPCPRRPLGRRRAQRSRRQLIKLGQAGFTMLGLIVLIAIVNILLAVAATSWVAIDRRARENELIWRGQQYLRALRCHQREAGSLPVELQELIDTGCLRRLYPDPVSEDGEWHLIRWGELQAELGSAGREASSTPATSGASEADPTRQRFLQGQLSRLEEMRQFLVQDLRSAEQGTGEERVEIAGARLQVNIQLSEAVALLRQSRVRGRTAGARRSNAIVGVVSTSGAIGTRMVGGSHVHSDWRFVLAGSELR